MAARKSGLGKGLDSLITGGKDAVKEEPKVIEKVVEKIVEKPAEIKLRISEIEPNRNQPRKDFNEDTLEELADSIRVYGVLFRRRKATIGLLRGSDVGEPRRRQGLRKSLL